MVWRASRLILYVMIVRRSLLLPCNSLAYTVSHLVDFLGYPDWFYIFAHTLHSRNRFFLWYVRGFDDFLSLLDGALSEPITAEILSTSIIALLWTTYM